VICDIRIFLPVWLYFDVPISGFSFFSRGGGGGGVGTSPNPPYWLFVRVLSYSGVEPPPPLRGRGGGLKLRGGGEAALRVCGVHSLHSKQS
jgi:hypothetical protein